MATSHLASTNSNTSKPLPTLFTNPITTILQSAQFRHQIKSTTTFILRRWVPKHWLTRALLTALRLFIRMTTKAVRLGMKYTGVVLIAQLLSHNLKLLLVLIVSQLTWTNIVSRMYYPMMVHIHRLVSPQRANQRKKITQEIEAAEDYPTWARATATLDSFDGLDSWKMDNCSEYYDFERLERFSSILLHLYLTQNTPAIVLLLSSHLTRNFCGILNPQLYTVLGVGTKQLIEDYTQLVNNSLDLVAQDEGIPLSERLSFFTKLRHVFGRSALMLSGGATLSLMHIGFTVELVRAGLMPTVISGSSGGAIMGGCLAGRSDREFLHLLWHHPETVYRYMYYSEPPDDVLYELYGPTPHFPPRPRKTLFDIRVLQHAIRQIVPGNATFLDLYHHSGRIFNVAIHSSGLGGGGGVFVANYLTAPHVYVATAVAASSALPGVFEPTPILYSRTYTKLSLAYLRGRLGDLVQKQIFEAQRLSSSDSGDDDETKAGENKTTPPSSSGINTSRSPRPYPSPLKQPPSNSKAINLAIIDDALKPIVEYVHNVNQCQSDQQEQTSSAPSRQPQQPFKSLFDSELTESEHESITALFGDTRLYQDGSLGADLPLDQLKEQFGVNFSIVSQVNPHVAPVLRCFPAFQTQDPIRRLYSIPIITKLMNFGLHVIDYLFSSFRSLILNLASANLIPWFPAVAHNILAQTYHGDITILPYELGPTDYKAAVQNPTLPLLLKYRRDGIRHTWNYITRLKIALKTELNLQRIVAGLRMMFNNNNNNNNRNRNYYYGPQPSQSSSTSTTTATATTDNQNLTAAPPSPDSPVQLQHAVMGTPTTPTLCRIESLSSQSQPPQQQQQSSTIAIGEQQQRQQQNHESLLHSQPQPIFKTTSTLIRRSSFFLQTYGSENPDDSTTATTAATNSNNNHNQIGNDVTYVGRRTHDADIDDYYDPDCYLYENPAAEAAPATPATTTTTTTAQNGETYLAAWNSHTTLVGSDGGDHADEKSQGDSMTITKTAATNHDDNNNNNFPSSQPPQSQHEPTTLRQHRNSSFYRIKSSFGQIDPNNHPQQPSTLPRQQKQQQLSASSPPTTPPYQPLQSRVPSPMGLAAPQIDHEGPIHHQQQQQQRYHANATSPTTTIITKQATLLNTAGTSSILLPALNNQEQYQWNEEE